MKKKTFKNTVVKLINEFESPHTDLEKTNFVYSEILGRHIWKKRIIYNKFEIATNCVNQIFKLKKLCFFLLTGAT